ncbi:glycosyl transferase [Marivirga lumbricoides]|uniref:Glycosyl transferase n=1 Tax=Marivirga lumbricoides TaxID=1046115 RepID=A0ABQ1MLP0_9BACT|nr:glycosyl transferase [Marivirga lumbricoides]
MKTIFLIFELIVVAYFLYVGLYTFMFGFASHFYRSKATKASTAKGRFVVLIPGYKEDGVIVSVAKDAVKQNYPQDKFDIVVIADSFQQETLKQLAELPIHTEIVSFEKSTKVKALNEVLGRIGDGSGYDYAVILDADNLMDESFLERMNTLHQQGFKAIQGRRAAKNDMSTLAYLDGLSEDINNNIYGKGSVALGCSSSLKGSGMSFSFALLKSELAQMASIGGFDRELELRLVKQGVKVYYSENAVIRDEKVEKNEVFENQRKRWISSQYHYLRLYFTEGLAALFKGNFVLFNSIILRNIQLPRLLNIGLVNFILVLAIVLTAVFSVLQIQLGLYILVAVLVDVGVFLAISKEYLNGRLVKSIILLPGIFLKMLLLMFKLKGANKKFIHTPHGETPKSKA